MTTKSRNYKRKYQEIIKERQHSQGINKNDRGTKPDLPIHMVLEPSDYARIKVQEILRVGSPGEPVTEITQLGWVIMSPGNEINLNDLMLSRTSTDDYEKLCNLDVLGVQDVQESDEDIVHNNFKQQLRQRMEGWYKIKLLWKNNKENLSNNKVMSLGRLQNLL